MTESLVKLTSHYQGQMLQCLPSAYTKHHSKRELKKEKNFAATERGKNETGPQSCYRGGNQNA